MSQAPEELDTSLPQESSTNPSGDVEMIEGVEGEEGEGENDGDLPFADADLVEPRTTFLSYLMSPVVTLLVGQGTEQVVLSAHQALLAQSPFFDDATKSLSEGGSVSVLRELLRPSLNEPQLTKPLQFLQPRQIELLDEDKTAVGSFLEYLYTGEYFPKKLPGQRVLEADNLAPTVDDTGDQLLKHARVYTLADKFGMSSLKTLSSSKIHCVNSTAKGEIAYARYVYEYTSNDDMAVRAPIASFWATRSHTLRSEAEEEFKSLCLEFPKFGYDVLSGLPRRFCGALQPTANNVQRASSTTSSSASATRRCIPHRQAGAAASVPVTAPMFRRLVLAFFLLYYSMMVSGPGILFSKILSAYLPRFGPLSASTGFEGDREGEFRDFRTM